MKSLLPTFVLLVFGSLFASFGAFMIWHQVKLRLQGRAVEVQGRITGFQEHYPHKKGLHLFPLAKFSVGGKEYETMVEQNTRLPRHFVGDEISFTIDQENPESVVPHQAEPFGFALCLLLIGLSFFFAGVSRLGIFPINNFSQNFYLFMLVALAAGSSIGGLASATKSFLFLQAAVPVDGRVLNYESVVRDRSGKIGNVQLFQVEYSFEGKVLRRPVYDDRWIGGGVISEKTYQVLVNKADPRDYRVYSFLNFWFVPLLLFIFASLIAGVVILVRFRS